MLWQEICETPHGSFNNDSTQPFLIGLRRPLSISMAQERPYLICPSNIKIYKGNVSMVQIRDAFQDEELHDQQYRFLVGYLAIVEYG